MTEVPEQPPTPDPMPLPTSNPLTPTRKVGSGALAGAVAVIALWAVETFTSADIPAEVAAAITTVLSFATSYFVPERP